MRLFIGENMLTTNNENEELGVDITLKKEFPLVKETLERMGIRNSKTRKFFPSCYCVEVEEGKYRLMHFKELFIRDGKPSSYDELDELRRNTILHFLVKWGFVETEEKVDTIMAKKIDVLNYHNKHEYTICHKYVFNGLPTR